MSDLIDTTEMYLRTIFELTEEGQVPLRARIAERLGQSGPTVSQTVARMERDGLVHVAGDRHLELTELGVAKATAVMRRHRLAECLLVDVIGLEWEFVHDEACRWEHVITERVERHLVKLLNHPTHSPYGNPIPGLDSLEHTDRGEDAFLDGVLTLGEAIRTGLSTMVVARLGEPVQADGDVLGRLSAAGIRPGALISARRDDDGYVIAALEDKAEYDIAEDIALHVFVSPA